MKNYSYILFFLFILLSLSGCKSWQKAEYDSTRKISRKKLQKSLEKNHFSARTFESKISISYRDASQQINGGGKIRILKDSIIWGSMNFLGIPVVKFIITPHRVRYYNKLQREYYDGDFDLIRQTYGVDLDFQHLQNLLLGDLISSLDLTEYKLSRDKDYYLLSSTDNHLLNEVKINPFFKIISEKINVSPREYLLINYADYQKIAKENIPRKINIQSQNTPNDIYLEIDYKSPAINKDLRFPFKIPSSYHPVKLP